MPTLLLPLPALAGQGQCSAVHQVMVGVHTWLSCVYPMALHSDLLCVRLE